MIETMTMTETKTKTKAEMEIETELEHFYCESRLTPRLDWCLRRQIDGSDGHLTPHFSRRRRFVTPPFSRRRRF